MSRFIFGVIVAVLYIGGTMLLSGATTQSAQPTTFEPSTEFRDCIVQVQGKNIGIRFYGLTNDRSATSTWPADSASAPKCQAVPGD